MANRFVNFGGIFLAIKLISYGSASLIDVIKAYFVASDFIGTDKMFELIKQNDTILPAKQQYENIIQIRENNIMKGMEKVLSVKIADTIDESFALLKQD